MDVRWRKYIVAKKDGSLENRIWKMFKKNYLCCWVSLHRKIWYNCYELISSRKTKMQQGVALFYILLILNILSVDFTEFEYEVCALEVGTAQRHALSQGETASTPRWWCQQISTAFVTALMDFFSHVDQRWWFSFSRRRRDDGFNCHGHPAKWTSNLPYWQN